MDQSDEHPNLSHLFDSESGNGESLRNGGNGDSLGISGLQANDAAGKKTRTFIEAHPGAVEKRIIVNLQNAHRDFRKNQSERENGRRFIGTIMTMPRGRFCIIGDKYIRETFLASNFAEVAATPDMRTQEILDSQSLDESVSDALPNPSSPLSEMGADTLNEFLTKDILPILEPGTLRHKYDHLKPPDYWPPYIDHVYAGNGRYKNFVKTNKTLFPYRADALREIIRYIYVHFGCYNLLEEGSDPDVLLKVPFQDETAAAAESLNSLDQSHATGMEDGLGGMDGIVIKQYRTIGIQTTQTGTDDVLPNPIPEQQQPTDGSQHLNPIPEQEQPTDGSQQHQATDGSQQSTNGNGHPDGMGEFGESQAKIDDTQSPASVDARDDGDGNRYSNGDVSIHLEQFVNEDGTNERATHSLPFEFDEGDLENTRPKAKSQKNTSEQPPIVQTQPELETPGASDHSAGQRATGARPTEEMDKGDDAPRIADTPSTTQQKEPSQPTRGSKSPNLMCSVDSMELGTAFSPPTGSQVQSPTLAGFSPTDSAAGRRPEAPPSMGPSVDRRGQKRTHGSNKKQGQSGKRNREEDATSEGTDGQKENDSFIDRWRSQILNEDQQLSDEVIEAFLEKIQSATNLPRPIDRLLAPSVQAVEGQVYEHHVVDVSTVVVQVHFLADDPSTNPRAVQRRGGPVEVNKNQPEAREHRVNGHWVASSKLPEQPISVYDSLPRPNKLDSNAKLRRHIREFYHVAKDPGGLLQVKYFMLPKQRGNYACGGFALAYATAVALGVKPETVSFRQSELRRHIVTTLESDSGELHMFPHSILRQHAPCIDGTMTVYCCWKLVPDMHPPREKDVVWIQCDTCEQWNHVVCFKDEAIRQQAIEALKAGRDFNCGQCSIGCHALYHRDLID